MVSLSIDRNWRVNIQAVSVLLLLNWFEQLWIRAIGVVCSGIGSTLSLNCMVEGAVALPGEPHLPPAFTIAASLLASFVGAFAPQAFQGFRNIDDDSLFIGEAPAYDQGPSFYFLD